MGNNFASKIAEWSAMSTSKLTDVFQGSALHLIDQASTLVEHGGRMPIDTGWLCSSILASLTGMPYGMDTPADAVRWRASQGLYLKYIPYDDTQIKEEIGNARLGDTIYAGWTAYYAVYQEYVSGFMRGAAQNWDGIVKKVTVDIQQGNYSPPSQRPPPRPAAFIFSRT